MSDKFDKRQFNRIGIELVTEISAEDMAGSNYRETTVLKDISGGGAKFITIRPERYFPDQVVEVTVYLPGSNKVRGRMRGKATVVRIDSEGDSEREEKAVAVRLDTPLRLERLT